MSLLRRNPVQLVYGINPLLELLKSKGTIVKQLVVASGKRGGHISEILDIASKAGIPVEFRDKAFLDRKTEGGVHQGIIGFTEEFSYASVDDIIANRHGEAKKDVILLLDGITDPHNLGSLIRTAHCFGINGVIIPKDRSASVTATTMKTSSGAAGYIPIAMEVNLAQTIQYLQSRGFWIYGAAAGEGQSVHRLNNDEEHVVVVMGSEGKGIRPLIKKKCDFFVSVPMKGKMDSLNVSVAAGIILYEISRVRDEA
jgi:23S rRNA (guanosine2251-2'-O)-methyltransferase